jgi:hypothetical protein
MRDKRKAKACAFVLIGGFAWGQGGTVKPTIILAHGNAYWEDHRVIESFPIGTRYQTVKARADAIALERGLTMGRDFTMEEWYGPEWRSPAELRAAQESADVFK